MMCCSRAKSIYGTTTRAKCSGQGTLKRSSKVVELWQLRNLPEVLGAVDGTLIVCPAPDKRYCYKKKCVPSQTAMNSSHIPATSLGTCTPLNPPKCPPKC
jgi:hypothetical protein